MRLPRTTDQHVLPPRGTAVGPYRWVYDAFRSDIIEGRLRPGARLASTRRLAFQLGVSRGTVVAAFEQLQSEGYLEGRRGSGTFVPSALTTRWLRPPTTIDSGPRKVPSPRRRLSAVASRARPFLRFGSTPPRAFRTHQPALDLFPVSLWARVTSQRLRRVSTTQLAGCGPMGYGPLQEVIADYLCRSRGVHCVPEQVAIVSGVQEALGFVTRLFVNPGDRVCLEDPGYSGAAKMFESAGATIVPVPIDREGMVIPKSGAKHARLCYVTPSHQFPLGIGMSFSRRVDVLEWARSNGTVIVEDDYDSEYRYAGRPLPALQGLDRHGLVLFMGSFSKVLFPSIRLGYLIVPLDLIDALTAMLSVSGQHAPLLNQATLCDFISDGHFARHLRRMRQIYGDRLSLLRSCAHAKLSGLLELSSIEAGLQVAARLLAPIDAETVAADAALRKVEVTPLARYARRPMTYDGLLLGFAAVDDAEIARGVDQLAATLERPRASRR